MRRASLGEEIRKENLQQRKASLGSGISRFEENKTANGLISLLKVSQGPSSDEKKTEPITNDPTLLEEAGRCKKDKERVDQETLMAQHQAAFALRSIEAKSPEEKKKIEAEQVYLHLQEDALIHQEDERKGKGQNQGPQGEGQREGKVIKGKGQGEGEGKRMEGDALSHLLRAQEEIEDLQEENGKTEGDPLGQDLESFSFEEREKEKERGLIMFWEEKKENAERRGSDTRYSAYAGEENPPPAEAGSTAIVVYPFQGEQKGELRLEEGEEVSHIEELEGGGEWCQGMAHGVYGVFPKACVLPNYQ